MKITSLKYQKKDPNRVSVFLDDEYSFSLHVNNVAKWNLHVGQELDQEEVAKFVKDDLKVRLYTRAINYLGRGFRSKRQMEQYLSKLLFQKQDDWYSSELDIDKSFLIESTITKLEQDGYIDDLRFAEAYSTELISRKAISKVFIRGKLYEKGIQKEIIDDVIEGIYPDEVEMAITALEKKYGSSKLGFEDKKKIQFLSRKGFNWSIISEIINRDI